MKLCRLGLQYAYWTYALWNVKPVAASSSMLGVWARLWLYAPMLGRMSYTVRDRPRDVNYCTNARVRQRDYTYAEPEHVRTSTAKNNTLCAPAGVDRGGLYGGGLGNGDRIPAVVPACAVD